METTPFTRADVRERPIGYQSSREKWPRLDRAGKPAAALSSEEFANKDSELLACDVECDSPGSKASILNLMFLDWTN